MAFLLCALMLCMLFHAPLVISTASAACRLFVTAVLPGLFPYMVLSQMLVSRMKRLSPTLVMLLGWGGGSPTGARLVCMGDFPPQVRTRLMLTCATMSPMFLLGTVGGWLGSPLAGAVCLGSSIVSGWVLGWVAIRRDPLSHPQADASSPQGGAFGCLTFGAAVESAARTMLLICGTMVMLRVFAALSAEVLPGWAVLPVTTLLEVTTGAAAIAELPLPLMWRTALLAGATGFGGMAILMQNRAVAQGLLPLGWQIFWQAVHGGMAFVMALGIMWLIC